MNNVLRYQSLDVNGNKADFQVPLMPMRAYHGLVLIGEADGVRNDSIINNVKIVRRSREEMTYSREFLRDENRERLVLSANQFVGVYDLPFVRNNHPEDVVAVNNLETLGLTVDVTKQGTTCKLIVYEIYFKP